MAQTNDLAECGCGKTIKAKPNKDGGLKTPMGWRRIDDVLLCPDCTQAKYYTRSVRVEMRGLAADEKRDSKEFRAACSAASMASGRCANWLVQRLLAADLALAPLGTTKDGKKKLPPCPEIDYYRAACDTFPELAPASIVALCKMVRDWYGARRWDALVALNRSVETYRFGRLPIEIPKQAWRLEEVDGKFLVRSQVGPGKAWRVKVYAAGRELAALKGIVSGECVPLALKIVRQSKTLANGATAKAWFFRISVMLPRKPQRQSHQEITLTLGHDPGVLLFGALEGSDDVFEWPGEALRKLIVGGDKADKKRQRELSMSRGLVPKRQLLRWGKDRTAICENRQRKVNYQLKLCAAALARWCKSRGVTSVDYDVTDRGFLIHCPWHQLKSDLRNTLEREGIALHVIGTEATEQDAIVKRDCETTAPV